MIGRLLYLLSIVMVLLFYSCSKNTGNEDYAVGRNPMQNVADEYNKKIDNSITSANKIISDKEKQRIQSFIQRRGWDMQEISGIYLQEVKKGTGLRITDKDIVTLTYKSCYINGDDAEDFHQTEPLNTDNRTFKNNKQTKKTNTLTFNVGGDTKVVYGLLYAVRNLSLNSVARVIVPDNLAFYLDENGEKVKASATLIYEIRIEKIIHQ